MGVMRWVLAASAALAWSAAADATRIKDIADIEGVRENQLVGYGLVVGLDGTGDGLANAPFTRQSLQSFLERAGVSVDADELNTANVAAVTVTANLPPFAMQGTRIDVTVSALADAQSLSGGTLVSTPLTGPDGQVYALAQGSVAVGGFAAGGDAASVTQGVPTSGRIANGAIIEREAIQALAGAQSLRLALRNPDFATASRVAAAVNRFVGEGTAIAENSAIVRLTRPPAYSGDMVGLLTDIEQLVVRPDQPAKIVIDEATGLVVMGEAVRVSTVAIAQGSLTVTVSETPQVSQPEPFGEGETVVVPRTEVGVEAGGAPLAVVEEGVTLKDLVAGLNALGVAPRDLVAILHGLKAAGAIQAEIEVM